MRRPSSWRDGQQKQRRFLCLSHVPGDVLSPVHVLAHSDFPATLWQGPVTSPTWDTGAWAAERARPPSRRFRAGSHPEPMLSSPNPASGLMCGPSSRQWQQPQHALPEGFPVFRLEGQDAVGHTLILVFSFWHQVSLPLQWKKIFYTLFLCMNNNCTSLILSKQKPTKWKMFNVTHVGSLWKFFHGTGSFAILTQRIDFLFNIHF